MEGSEIIYKYFPELTPLQKEQIEKLYPLYLDWNSKINVISRKDIDFIYLHHVLHSLAIAKIAISSEKEDYPVEEQRRRPCRMLDFSCGKLFRSGDTVLDLGTGGGFPGIPLAILFPQVHFTLCDSIAKKIRVASEVSAALSLENVETVCARAETLPGPYNWIVSRAVTSLTDFLPWVRGKYSDGLIFLKGGDTDAEIRECCANHGLSPTLFQTIDIQKLFPEEYFEGKRIVGHLATFCSPLKNI